MHFEHIILSPQVFPDPMLTHLYSPTQLPVFFLSFFHPSQFVLLKYSDVWGLHWSMVDLLGVISLKKTNSFFPQRLSNANFFSAKWWDFMTVPRLHAETLFNLSLYRSLYAAVTTISSYVQLPYDVNKHIFVEVIYLLWLLQPFYPLFYKDSSVLEERA